MRDGALGVSIFLSYSIEQNALAERVESRLRERGHVVNRDRHTMRFGGNWREEVLPQIDVCDAFLLMWSASANESLNVHEEIHRAVGKGKFVLTCLLDETALPGFLTDVQWFPVAPDLTGFDEVLFALTPRAGGAASGKASDRLAAAQTLLAQSRRRFASFQVLYPGESRPADEAVSLRLVEGAHEARDHSSREYSISELLSVLAPGERTIVLGHPGSGKTTMLLLAAHQLCSTDDTAHLPVYLKCKDFRPSRHTTLARFVVDTIRQDTTAEVAARAEEFGLAAFGLRTLLIDGFDELPAGTQPAFRELLDAFLEEDDASGIRLLLTMRVDTFRAVDTTGDGFRGWRRFRFQPLDWPRICDFANQWFDKDNDVQAFLAEVVDPRLIELAERPFLLAMMCLVFEKDHDLGANRAELYRRAIHFLEVRRGDQTSDHVLALRSRALRALALRGLQMGVVELDRWIAAGITAAELDEDDSRVAHNFEAIFAFLDEAAREVGVLQAGGTDYSFLHRSFQEYLAAETLGAMAGGEGILLEHCRVPSWEEPVRLHVGTLKGPERQLSFLRPLWQLNNALSLRALTELGRGAANVIAQLLADSTPADRARMLHQVRNSLSDLEPRARRRLVIETAAPLLDAETDNEVLYWAVALIQEVDPDDSTGTLTAAFGQHADVLRRTLVDDPRYRFELVPIEGATFTMGDNGGQDDIEKPAHIVGLEPFRFGRWQLTNLAYEYITGRSAADRPAYAREDQHPVVELSWFDAFIAAFRIGCRLPTEAEWEYAARGGTSTSWSHGDDESLLDEYANYEGNPATHGTPWPVGTGKPNPWGLSDVHGNVWEWCQDWLGPYSDGPLENPQGPAEGTQRVRRGGGHSYHARGCRSAFRWGNDPGYRFKDIGVRVAADSEGG